MRAVLPLLALPVVILAPGYGGAQVPISVDVYGGVSAPLGDFADGYAADGVAYGVDATLHFNRHVGIWAGWSRSGFRCDVEACPSGGDASSTHTSGGVTFRIFDTGRVRPWVRGGMMKGSFSQTGEEVKTGTYIAVPFETDSGVGVDLSVGAHVPIRSAISVSPVVRYRTYTAEYELHGTGQGDFEVGFMSFELAVRIGPFD